MILLPLLERNVVKILFVEAWIVLGAGTGAATLASASATGRSPFAALTASSEELDIVGDYVDLGALGAVLGLPGTVLELAFYEDRIALLLVVGDGLAKLSPGGDVEEVDLFTLGAHPVYRDAEPADRYAVVRKP